MIDLKRYKGYLECPNCKSKTNIYISTPVIDGGRVLIEKEVFCSNEYCEAKMKLTAIYIKYKKDPEGNLKINKFLFNGEEKDKELFLHLAE